MKTRSILFSSVIMMIAVAYGQQVVDTSVCNPDTSDLTDNEERCEGQQCDANY